MKVLRAYIEGWQTLFSTKRVWLLLYVFNLLFALIIVLPLQSLLSDSVANSLTISKSLKSFDFTFLSEFLREYGSGVSVIVDTALWVVMFYALFNIFLSGGVLRSIKRSHALMKDFWEGSSNYFWRMLRLALLFLVIQGLLVFAYWVVYKKLNADFNFFTLESDDQILHSFYYTFPLYVLIAGWFFMLHDYARVLLVARNEFSMFGALVRGGRFIIKNFFSTFFLYLLNFLIFALLFGLYWWLNDWWSANTTGKILMMLGVGQLFVLFRIGLKIVNWGSIYYLMRGEQEF